MTAGLLMLCLGLFSAESLIADVHDGDATAGAVVCDAARAGSVGDANTDASGSAVRALGGPGNAATVRSMADVAAPAQGDSGLPVGSHVGGHTEHCTHAHTAPAVARAALPVALSERRGAIRPALAVLASRDVSPRLRPPIG